MFGTRCSVRHEFYDIQKILDAASHSPIAESDVAGQGALERHSAPHEMPHARHVVGEGGGVGTVVKPAHQIELDIHRAQYQFGLHCEMTFINGVDKFWSIAKLRAHQQMHDVVVNCVGVISM